MGRPAAKQQSRKHVTIKDVRSGRINFISMKGKAVDLHSVTSKLALPKALTVAFLASSALFSTSKQYRNVLFQCFCKILFSHHPPNPPCANRAKKSQILPSPSLPPTAIEYRVKLLKRNESGLRCVSTGFAPKLLPNKTVTPSGQTLGKTFDFHLDNKQIGFCILPPW